MDLLFLPATGPVAITSLPPLSHRPSENHTLVSVACKTSVSFSKITKLFPRLTTDNLSVASVTRASSSWSVAAATTTTNLPAAAHCTRWLVAMEKPPSVVGSSRPEVIDYYVHTLAKVLGSEKEAQMSIYDASWENWFGFCCEIDEEYSRELARMPGVLSVMPDHDKESGKKDCNDSSTLQQDQVRSEGHDSRFSPNLGNNVYWLVRMEKPGVEVVTKAQMVDYYSKTLTKVLGNEQDAQVCIYNISWEKDFGFCCHIDEKCARELADVPGVLSIRPDTNFESDNKDYRGNDSESSEANQTPHVRTKRLFVTGLSFYTSEKTLRAAFEDFGELVEVKIIMDKISKRSKGYAFIEYTTEEAAGAALKEMNGKIINGWMIVVDVARNNPPRYGNRRPLPSSSAVPSY